jgi:3-deoxy-7-phosphoheptulonate synthase
MLPQHIEVVRQTCVPVIWCCDPCHGNTQIVQGVKTRHLADLQRELRLAFEIHGRLGSRLAGVHLELTPDDVTECMGGEGCPGPTSLGSSSYQTFCDPRLNYTQSLEMAVFIAEELRMQRQQQQQGLSLPSVTAAANPVLASPVGS